MSNHPQKPQNESGRGLAALPATGTPPSAEISSMAFPEALAGNLVRGEPAIIATWAKNSRESLRVKLDTFKGQPVIDARVRYEGKGGTLRPGRGGLTVSVKHLPALAAAMATALDVATCADFLESPESGEL